MMDHDRCPSCRSFDTEQVEITTFATELEEKRTCESCSTTFANKYEMTEREEDVIL